MILTDNETKVDLLNNEAIATTIIKLLRARPDRPITVGIHGDWGAGKSSILEMLEAGLEKDDKVLCLKFNGWRFQGFEDAKIVLLEGIVTGLIEKRPALTKAGDAVKTVLRRIDWLKVAKKAGGLAFTGLTGIPTPDQLQMLGASLKGLVSDPARLDATIETVNSFLKPAEEGTNVPEEINAFRKEFDELLTKAGIEQLIVLIDDLDRCLPDTAIETLEAVRLFVFTSRTAFVVAADEAMIEYAVRKHFPNLPDTTGPHSYARNYLEKLIQVPFRIPALGDAETRIYVTLLLIGAALGDDAPEFNRLIAAARQRLRQPWKAGPLDSATIKKALGDKAGSVEGALNLSDQIAPILASGTSGNPRQIKRFLNMLVLRQRTAEARGFGDDVKQPVLAKLMLAERFLPQFFDQIAGVAASDSAGRCGDLAALEDIARVAASGGPGGRVRAATDERSPGGKRKAKPAAARPSSKTLAEWGAAPALVEWAAIEPAIGHEDLRPYLFVAKDRKDYFGAASVLGHLAAVVEQLFGPKLLVQGLEADLKRLAPAEAGQIFEAVRSRIVGGDVFDSEPPGVAGLGVLVRAQPSLQEALVGFLEGLPIGRLGPWACKGWEGAITGGDASRRFDVLLGTWTRDGEGMLKAAAQVASTRAAAR